jgi:tetratricopeptide (TPR) repeat protein
MPNPPVPDFGDDGASGSEPAGKKTMVVRLVIACVVVVSLLAAIPAFRQGVSSTAGVFGEISSQAAQQTPETFLQATRRAIAHGQLAEAETLAKARPAGDAEAAAVLARIEATRGQYDAALRGLQAAVATQPGGEASLELGLLLKQQFGRHDEAAPHLNRVLNRSTQAQDAETLFRAARAAQALRQIQDANTLFRTATRAADPGIETAWGNLFLETFNPREALKSFQQVLKQDDSWAPALLGVARTLANENPPAAAAAAEQALKIDPQYADAQLFLAELDLDNTRYTEARERIDRVLTANPSHLEARALLAAIGHVRGDKALYDAEVARVLAINPAFGEIYRVAGDLAARNYRFDEAVALARQAMALDPTNIRAASDLGLHLMRTGDEAEAARAGPRVQGVSVRPGHVQPARAARQAGEVRGRAGR